MPCTHHFLIDPIQDVRGKQPQVVLEGLQLIVGRVRPVAVPEHLAQRAVLVGQLLDAVIIRVEPQA